MYSFFIKFRIDIVEILRIHLLFCLLQRLSEPLEMDDLLARRNFSGSRTSGSVIIRSRLSYTGPGLLFCRQVFRQVSNGIAFGLEFHG